MTDQSINDIAWDLFVDMVRDRQAEHGSPTNEQARALMLIGDSIKTYRRVKLYHMRQGAVFTKDIGAAISDDCLEGVVGYVYVDSLFIEWNDKYRQWRLLIGNSSHESTDLELLEIRLWLWALANDYRSFDLPENVQQADEE